MEFQRNAFKQALRSRVPQIGIWSMIASPIAVEILGDSGFDWICIDTEHSPVEISDLLTLLQASTNGPTHQVVRSAWNDPVLLKRILDVGAQTVLVPFIQNAEQAAQAVSACHYPPDGIRGVSGNSRSSRYGRVKSYLRSANDEICVIAQLETSAALANIEAIADVKGIDGIFIGPSDLSASMGYLGNPEHPAVQEQISRTLAALKARNVPAGILAANVDDATRFLEAGFTFVAASVDTKVLIRGLDEILSQLRLD